MSDMKTIMENFRQFERKDMENRIDELLKENKNLKKQLNKARKLHEGVMGGLGVSPLKIGAATAAGKKAAAATAERKRIGGQLHAIAEAIGAEVNCDDVDYRGSGKKFPIEIQQGDIILVPRTGSTSTEVERQNAQKKAQLLRREILQYLAMMFKDRPGDDPGDVGPMAIDKILDNGLVVTTGDVGIGYQLSLVGRLDLDGCILKRAFEDAGERFEALG